MPAGLGRRTRVNLAKWFASQTPDTAPAGFYLSLHSSDPGDIGAGTGEVSGNGYTRAQVTTITTIATPAADGAVVISNSGSYSHPESTGSWASGSNLTHFGLWEHVSTTTEAVFLGRGALSSPIVVGSSGITVQWANAAMQFNLVTT